MINCGCNYDGDDYTCYNKFPECPSLGDPGQNFGKKSYYFNNLFIVIMFNCCVVLYINKVMHFIMIIIFTTDITYMPLQ